ncbi:MAG: patatin-like phospholipase family protein [Elusimicrobiota bacterium]
MLNKVILFLILMAPAVFTIQAQEPGLLKGDEILRELMWDKLVLLKPPARPGVGLALSGGGARGFAHAGVLEALDYAAFPVDYVSGTSMGSVVGGLYSSGMSVPDIWKFANEASTLKVSRDFRGIKVLSLLLTNRLLTPTYINQFIEKNLGSLTFENLKKPFACVAMDFRTGEKIIFNDGPLAIAVRASVNLPGIFAPLEYRHRYLVDGGVVDFIPIDAARLLGADWVLASVAGGVSNELPENVLTSLLQVIDIRGSMLAANEEKQSDFVIKPEVGKVKMADFEQCQKAGEAGLMEATKRVDSARESYLIFSAPSLLEAL